MKYKLIVIDLDDTLLDNDKIISNRAKKAIQASILKGTLVTFATGRMYKSALPYALDIGLTIPLITYQGALVKYTDGREIYHLSLPIDLAKKIVEFIRPFGIHMNIYFKDELYALKETEWGKHYAENNNVKLNIIDSLDDKNIAPTKIVLIGESEALTDLHKKLHEKFKDYVDLTRSKPEFLEISHPEATKGEALKKLANILKIPREEIIAIGDEMNDLDMIEYAGCGVAIGNACEKLKKAADIVTLSNNDDGVADVIERLILQD